MLFVNNKPALSGPGFRNEINLTDTAYSDASVVYLDKKFAPLKHHLVWVTIDDPNGGTMLERYMYVENVLYEEYSDPVVRDENGEPILDVNGHPTVLSLKDSPGWVKVILREHKHALTQYKSEDHFNIPALLPYAAPDVYGLDKFKPYNYMDWDGIRTFLSAIGIAPFFPENDAVPIVPVNLYWQGLLLADCLDDLLFSFSCRVVEKVKVRPFSNLLNENFRDPEVIDNLPTLTDLVWKRRRYMDHDPDIIYDTILWPENPVEERNQQMEQLNPVFPIANARDFEYLGRSGTNPATGMVDFPCNKVIAGGDYTEIRDYIKSTAINFNYYYSFTTRRLPAEFLEEKEWSKISYVFDSESFIIKVEHLPRLMLRPTPDIVPRRAETYVGRITSVSPTTVSLTDLRNLTYPNKQQLLRENFVFNFSGIDDSNVGKDLTFKVENGVVSPVSTSSLFSPMSDAPLIKPMHNGEILTSVTHEIYNLDPACTDDKISFGLNPIYDYRYHSHEYNPLAPAINQVVYEVDTTFTFPRDYWFFKALNYAPWMKVRFEMIPTREDLVEYLETLPSFTAIGDEYIEACSLYWYNNFRYVNIYFNFSVHPTLIDWRYTTTQPISVGSPSINYSKVMSPDVDSQWFTGPGGQVHPPHLSFPLTFTDPETPVTVASTTIPTRGSIGIDYDNLVRDLASRYINNHLHSFQAIVSITTEPEE